MLPRALRRLRATDAPTARDPRVAIARPRRTPKPRGLARYVAALALAAALLPLLVRLEHAHLDAEVSVAVVAAAAAAVAVAPRRLRADSGKALEAACAGRWPPGAAAEAARAVPLPRDAVVVVIVRFDDDVGGRAANGTSRQDGRMVAATPR